MFLREDLERIKELAKKVADVAEDLANEEKIALWKQHNLLKGRRLVMFVHLDGVWRELITDDMLRCENSYIRDIEYELLKRLIQCQLIPDDMPITKKLKIHKFKKLWVGPGA